MEIIALPQALKLVGDSDMYQYRVFFISCLQMFITATQVAGQTYLFIQPQLLCDGEPCSKYGDDYCENNYKITVDTDSFQYDNIVTNYSLWCGQKYLATISQSMYFLGNVFGGVIMSYLGDKYGRRKTYIISWGITTIGSVGIFTSVSIYQFMVMSTIMGFGAMPTYILNYVLLNESSGQRFRQKASIAALTIWSCGGILTSITYFYIHNWRIVYGSFVTLPAIVQFFLCFMIVETPQFYCTKKNIQGLIKSLDSIAIINKREKFSDQLPSLQGRLDPSLTDQRKQIYQEEVKKEIPKVYNILHLFKYRSLRKASIGFIIISFTVHLVYQGGQYSISEISQGNTVYILGGVMGGAELIGYLWIRQFIQILPRQRTLIVSYIFSLLFCASFLYFGLSSSQTKTNCDFCSKEIIVICISGVIRIFNSFAFALQGLYANEVYPTCVRSLGSGFLFSVGLFGSFLSPYVIAVADHYNLNPYILIGLISIAGPFATLLVPETLNQKLENQIYEKLNQVTSIE